MRKTYKINQHNSTVSGYPGRNFDWSKFCWDGSEIYHPPKISGYTVNNPDGDKAPIPWVDKGLIAEGNEYLHVPYNWSENSTIYRVRPNESMQAGETYRGRKVRALKAVKQDDGWYWELEF